MDLDSTTKKKVSYEPVSLVHPEGVHSTREYIILNREKLHLSTHMNSNHRVKQHVLKPIYTGESVRLDK